MHRILVLGEGPQNAGSFSITDLGQRRDGGQLEANRVLRWLRERHDP